MKPLALKTWIRNCYDCTKSVCRQKKEIAAYLKKCRGVDKHKFHPLARFKDIHKGERVFIVATGPSLTVEDVNKLKNEVCFIMNSGFKLLDTTDINPRYYAIADGTVYRRVLDDLKGRKLPVTFYNDKDISWQSDIVEAQAFPLPMSVSLILNSWQRAHLPAFLNRKRVSRDIEKCVYMGDTIVNIIIQICFYMGFKEIYLIGTDCNYSGTNLHSNIAKYKNDTQLHSSPDDIYRGMIQDYESLHEFSQKIGVKIFNATRGGQLEVFPRVNLDDIVNN